jgi:hypothetical protein
MQDKLVHKDLLDHRVQLVLQATQAAEAAMDNLDNLEAGDC